LFRDDIVSLLALSTRHTHPALFAFLQEIIPTYFDNPIIFPSFLNKLSRWGFSRVSSKQTGRFEFCSPTFKRLGNFNTSAAAAATGKSRNTGGDGSVQVQQQQVNPSSSQAMAPPNPNPLSSSNDNLADLISTIQRISQQQQQQQTPISSQQPIPNQNTHQQQDNAAAISTVQSLLGNNQQPFQQFQQINPTMNILNNLVGGQQPSPAQSLGYPSLPSQGNANALHAFLSLSGMLSQQQMYPHQNSTAAMSQVNNNMAVQSLLMLLQRIGEEERQRRAQSDAIQNAIISTIVQILGVNNAEAERQREIESKRIPTGMTVRVPYHDAGQHRHGGITPSAARNRNFQASSQIAAILQAARRENAAEQLEVEDARAQDNSPDSSGDVDDDNEEGECRGEHDEQPLSSRKRKSPDAPYPDA